MNERKCVQEDPQLPEYDVQQWLMATPTMDVVFVMSVVGVLSLRMRGFSLFRRVTTVA